MYREIAANKRKTIYIMSGFLLVVGLLAWFISAVWFNNPSITIVVLAIAVGYALFSYFNAGRMAVAVNGAREIQESDNPRLYRIVENLAITNGMPMPKVYVIEDPGMNAFATGRDPDHAIVAATSGIMEALDDAQLEGVMAHELGHVKNYDIRVSMIAFALVTVVALISDIMLRSLWFGGGSRDNRGGGNQVLALVGLAAAILAPIAAGLLQLAISRKREYLADATGALTTRYPEGLAQALEIISKNPKLKRQNNSTAHLFIANPLKGAKLGRRLFSTHPPIEDRVARLRQMGAEL